MSTSPRQGHIVLTSHPGGGRVPAIHWGAADALRRGPVVGTLGAPARRNVIGAHAGSYALYRALAVAARSLDPVHIPDLTGTAPAAVIGPHPRWADADAIVSLDPWGHRVAEVFAEALAKGWDIRPTIAVTKARIQVPELTQAVVRTSVRRSESETPASATKAVSQARHTAW